MLTSKKQGPLTPWQARIRAPSHPWLSHTIPDHEPLGASIQQYTHCFSSVHYTGISAFGYLWLSSLTSVHHPCLTALIHSPWPLIFLRALHADLWLTALSYSSQPCNMATNSRLAPTSLTEFLPSALSQRFEELNFHTTVGKIISN